MQELDSQMLERLKTLRQEHPYGWGGILSKSSKYADLAKWMCEKTPLLNDSKYTWTTRAYWILNGLVDFPPCPVCGSTEHMHKNVDHPTKGYFRACTPACAAANPDRNQKIKQTTFDHFGSSNFFTSEAGKAKQKAWLEKNGIENAFQLESVKLKSNASRKAHFGYEFTMQSPEKRKLASDNYRTKTGYDHQFHDPAIKAKIEEKRLHKIELGIDEKAKFKSNWKRRRYQRLVELHGEVEPAFSFDDFKRCNGKTQYTTVFKWHCNKCGTIFEGILDPNLIVREHLLARCPNCHPILCGVSKPEIEMIDFIKSIYYGEVLSNCKKLIYPLEVDCYVPARNLAFEFDGLFYHSEISGQKSKFYHLAKTDNCKSKGIQLIHIFEDEWKNRNDIVKSRIANILGIYERTTYARKCRISPVDHNLARVFQEANHLQGAVNAKVNLGLYHNSELVSLMTFGKPRFDKKHEWELLRFCNKLGYHIPGAASKLLKHFERQYRPRSIVSYADRRWSRGKLYEALGFKLDHVSAPNYWYLTPKTLVRCSRIQFQKAKLKNMLPAFDPAKSEVENMLAAGYDRIFDCGNLVYIKTY